MCVCLTLVRSWAVPFGSGRQAAAKWDDTSVRLFETQARLVACMKAEMQVLREGLASIPPEVMKDLEDADRLCESKLRSVSGCVPTEGAATLQCVRA